jgi:methionyl-tRNA formyltransferase
MKIAFLSVLHDPFLGRFLQKFYENELIVDAVILDENDISEKNLNLFIERTGKRMPPLSLYGIDGEKIPFYFVPNHNGNTCIDLIKTLKIDILINAGTPRIANANLLKAPRIGIVNCHPGLLPNFRGCSSVEWAIYFDKQVGNTVHFMNEGIDTGPIILQEGLLYSKQDRYVDVRVKVYEQRYDLLVKGIRKILNNQLTPSSMPLPQNGPYYGVIEDKKMCTVLLRLERGEYAYQI